MYVFGLKIRSIVCFVSFIIFSRQQQLTLGASVTKSTEKLRRKFFFAIQTIAVTFLHFPEPSHLTLYFSSQNLRLTGYKPDMAKVRPLDLFHL